MVEQLMENGRTQAGEIQGGLSPMGGTQQWGGRRI